MNADEYGLFLSIGTILTLRSNFRAENTETAEIFFKILSSLQKLTAKNAKDAKVFINIALRTLRSLR